MAYVVLARKYRPIRFDDVVGQEHVTTTLSNAIKTHREGHAYLFIGPRGVGKTTTARIMARALNCEKGPTAEPCGECPSCRQIIDGTCLDLIEMDAASNTGVDSVRELREHVRFAPTQCRFKIYIIDEVHMLSTGAFNALLKTLEEPPPHVRFILATTESRKIPPTIISRCQRFEFRLVSEKQLTDHVRSVCDSEGIDIEPQALTAIARAATGSVRDALSLTDQLAACGKGAITLATLNELLGLADWESLGRICEAIADRDVTACLLLVNELDEAGKDIVQFVQDLLEYFRHLLVARVADNPEQLISTPGEEQHRIIDMAARFSAGELTILVEECAGLASLVNRHVSARVALETFLIRACRETLDTSLSRVIEMMADLERRLADGPAVETRCNPTGHTSRSVPDVDSPPVADDTDSAKPDCAETNPAGQETGSPERRDVADGTAGQWQQVMSAVESNYTLFSMLNNVVPVGVDNDEFIVEVGPAGEFFKKSLGKREYKRLVETKIAEVFGRTLKFVCRVNKSIPAQPAQPEPAPIEHVVVSPSSQPVPAERRARRKKKKAPPAEHITAEDRDRVSRDEGVRKIIDTFGGRLSTVRKLELRGET